MEIFDYSELIRVVKNTNAREELEIRQHRSDTINDYLHYEEAVVKSGIIQDWVELKNLLSTAKIRLNVAHLGESSIGIVTGKGDYHYCSEYEDNGFFGSCMSSGSYWSDYFGFKNLKNGRLNWEIYHTTGYKSFTGFKTVYEECLEKRKILEEFCKTYQDYRDFQLEKLNEMYANRIQAEDILK